MSVLQLKRQRKDLIDRGVALMNTVTAEERDLTTEEGQKLADLKQQAETLQHRIEMAEEWEGLAEEVRDLPAAPTRPEVGQETATPRRDTTWRSFGEFMQAVYRAGVPGGWTDPRLYEQRAPSGLSEGVPSDGGFLVGQDFVTELFRRSYTMGEITRRCRRWPISSGANGTKINAINETSRATGSRWGGIQAYWLAEAGVKTASQPEFRQIVLDLKKLAVLVYATDEVLQDTTQLETLISEAATEEIMFFTENAIINGLGAGQPLGIMNAPCLVTVTPEVGQAATTLVAENVIKMWSRMWARSRANAVWLINQDVEPQLFTMSIAVGTGGVPVYMPAGGLSGSPFATLFSRPVIPVEYAATLGTTGDIILADFSQYFLADKGGVQAASSMHVRFLYDEMVFRFVYRVDGQPAWNSALTPASGSGNTLSPFVVLDTRS